MAEKEKNSVNLETKTEVAVVRQNITINQAIGGSQAKKLQSEAEASTFQIQQEEQAAAYKTLMTDLGLDTDTLLEYVKVGLVRSYPNGNLVINMHTGGSNGQGGGSTGGGGSGGGGTTTP